MKINTFNHKKSTITCCYCSGITFSKCFNSFDISVDTLVSAVTFIVVACLSSIRAPVHLKLSNVVNTSPILASHLWFYILKNPNHGNATINLTLIKISGPIIFQADPNSKKFCLSYYLVYLAYSLCYLTFIFLFTSKQIW